MPEPITSTAYDQPTPSAKRFWEDPCITLERDLELRAQGGPPGSGPDAPWRPPGMLGPLNTSGNGNCG